MYTKQNKIICKRVHIEPHSDFKDVQCTVSHWKTFKLHKLWPLSLVYLRTSQLICYTIIPLQYTRHVLLDWTRLQEQVLRQQHNHRIGCSFFFGCEKEHTHTESTFTSYLSAYYVYNTSTRGSDSSSVEVCSGRLNFRKLLLDWTKTSFRVPRAPPNHDLKRTLPVGQSPSPHHFSALAVWRYFLTS